MSAFRHPTSVHFCKENMPKKRPLKNRKIETGEQEKHSRFQVSSPFFLKKIAVAEP